MGVGMSLFLIKHSRPDPCNAVRELTKALDGTNEAAHKEMMRIIKCVIDAKDLGLKIDPVLIESFWQIVVFSNSDWAGDKDGRKSVGGHMIFLN